MKCSKQKRTKSRDEKEIEEMEKIEAKSEINFNIGDEQQLELEKVKNEQMKKEENMMEGYESDPAIPPED